jgi:hypothetical protein
MSARLATLAALGVLALAACATADRVTEPLAVPSFAIQPAEACDGAAMTVAECEALVALYNSTNGDQWNDNSNWGANADPCTWFGVTCNINISVSPLPYVMFLDLSNNGLSGAIPPQVGDLDFTSSLRLTDNNLTGTIPAELGGLPALDQLHLGGNQLSGQIPPELGDLADLQALTLSFNQLTGTIPTELVNLGNLLSLDLIHNQLSGLIPPELGTLDDLVALRLQFNQLTGPVPADLAGATSLTILTLQANELTGPIPEELASLTGLVNLHLFDNQLSGLVPLAVAILGDPMQSCGFGGNDGLFIPDIQAYRDADQDGDGSICGLALATAEDIGEDAADEIEELVPDPLNAGQANALTSKIENAVAKAANGQYQAAINQLLAFISQLNNMVGDGTLTPEQAAPFLTQAQALLDIWAESL